MLAVLLWFLVADKISFGDQTVQVLLQLDILDSNYHRRKNCYPAEYPTQVPDTGNCQFVLFICTWVVARSRFELHPFPLPPSVPPFPFLLLPSLTFPNSPFPPFPSPHSKLPGFLPSSLSSLSSTKALHPRFGISSLLTVALLQPQGAGLNSSCVAQIALLFT